MINEVNEINWDKIMDKFSSFDESILDFCKENNISHHQLYYLKKSRKAKEQTAFLEIKSKSEETVNSRSFNSNKIKVIQDCIV